MSEQEPRGAQDRSWQDPQAGTGPDGRETGGGYPYGPAAPTGASPWPDAQPAAPAPGPDPADGPTSWAPWSGAGTSDPAGPGEAWRAPAGGSSPAARPPAPQDASPYAYPSHPTAGTPGGGDGQRYGGERYGGGAPGPGLPTSTVVLLVVSALAVFTGVATLAGVPALVLAVIAAATASGDRERAERLTRTGWIVFAAVIAGTVLLVVLGVVLLLAVGGVASGAFAGF